MYWYENNNLLSGGLSSGWSLIRVVFYQVVSYQVVSHQGGLLSGGLLSGDLSSGGLFSGCPLSTLVVLQQLLKNIVKPSE